MSKAGGNGSISEKPAQKIGGGSSGPALSIHLPAGPWRREFRVAFVARLGLRRAFAERQEANLRLERRGGEEQSKLRNHHRSLCIQD
jgi:hypothetical protein